MVGFFQLHSVAPGFATAEWGFVLGSRYWGTGLFRAGAELMLNIIFNTIGVRRLEARADVDNGRANGALRKMGATGMPPPSIVLVDDQDRDDVLWSLLDDEWRAHPLQPLNRCPRRPAFSQGSAQGADAR
ncbi:MAG: GNAT family protein [Vicinamibacterales bacterium]